MSDKIDLPEDVLNHIFSFVPRYDSIHLLCLNNSIYNNNTVCHLCGLFGPTEHSETCTCYLPACPKCIPSCTWQQCEECGIPGTIVVCGHRDGYYHCDEAICTRCNKKNAQPPCACVEVVACCSSHKNSACAGCGVGICANVCANICSNHHLVCPSCRVFVSYNPDYASMNRDYVGEHICPSCPTWKQK
jgi:hypothetical protein